MLHISIHEQLQESCIHAPRFTGTPTHAFCQKRSKPEEINTSGFTSTASPCNHARQPSTSVKKQTQTERRRTIRDPLKSTKAQHYFRGQKQYTSHSSSSPTQQRAETAHRQILRPLKYRCSSGQGFHGWRCAEPLPAMGTMCTQDIM